MSLDKQVLPSQWLCEQLHTSMEAFIWTALQIPGERWYMTPPQWLGDWSLARHVFHVCYQECHTVQAGIEAMLRSGAPIEVEHAEEAAWQNEQPDVQEQLSQLQRLRQRTIDLLAPLSQEEWEKLHQDTLWGRDLSLQWAATKAWQHTLEHTHNILRLYLFGDPARYQSNT